MHYMGVRAAISAPRPMPVEPRRKQGNDARMGKNQAFNGFAAGDAAGKVDAVK